MNIIPFCFEKAEVRTLIRNGDPWFVLADVCRVLEIGNTSDAARRLDDDEKDGVDTIDPIGRQQQQTTIINESGLFSLVLTSRKPAAKRFKKWVTCEVLPAIRKTGTYRLPAMPESLEELVIRAMDALKATVEQQKLQLDVAIPKAQALDRIATATGSLSVTAAAKALQIRPKDLFNYLTQHGWIYKRPGSAAYFGYQPRTIAGDLEHKVITVLYANGSERVMEQVLITAKGLTKLAILMKPLALVC